MTLPFRTIAYAPGGIGNLGPGLDVLGAAVTGGGDTVTATWSETAGISLLDPGDPELPCDVERHASALAARAVLHAAAALGHGTERGVALHVRKGLPLSAGQGGSASSSVAGAAATNALLGDPLDARSLLAAALVAEEKVAGRHLDNIAPSLLGGIVLIRSLDPIDVLSLPVPAGLHVVMVHPEQRLRTADARAVLPEQVPRAIALHQMACVAAMVAALYEGDIHRFARAIDDRIAEPARAPLLRGFREAKAAGLAAGALGASISGGGPSAFAICDARGTALEVAHAMVSAYARAGMRATARVERIDSDGTTIRRLDAQGMDMTVPSSRSDWARGEGAPTVLPHPAEGA